MTTYKQSIRMGFSFVPFLLASLVLTFSIGLFIGRLNGVTPSLLNVLWWALRVVIKFGGTWVAFTLFAWTVAHGLLKTTLRDLFLQMHDTVALQENLSPFAVLGGLFIAVAQIFSLTASTPSLYAYDVLTKGSMGIFLGLIMTVAFIRVNNGITSWATFDQLFKSTKNNQLVLFSMIVFNVAIHFAMTT